MTGTSGPLHRPKTKLFLQGRSAMKKAIAWTIMLLVAIAGLFVCVNVYWIMRDISAIRG